MAKVFLTSDLHIGHPRLSRTRGFDSLEEHDEFILEKLNSVVGRRDKVFLLGDICWSKQAVQKFTDTVICENVDIVLGNHDVLRYYPPDFFNHVYGVYQYRSFVLSHVPIKEESLYRFRGNLHGHIHDLGGDDDLGLGPEYLNVNLEFNSWMPWEFEEIDELFTRRTLV